MIALIMRLTGLSRVVTIGGLVALAVIALGVGKCSYDRSIIKAHDASVVAKAEKAARQASDEATANQTAAQGDFAEQQSNITEGVNNAIQANSSATGAYFDRLRAEQAGRH